MSTQDNDLFPAPTTPDKLPDYALADGDLGNENVGNDDLAIPRIKLLQSLSPEVVEGFKDARPGLLMNSVTNQIFESIYVINLGYVRQWGLFKKKKNGGGFHGNHPTEAAAKAELAQLPGDESEYEIFETARHSLLMFDEQGEIAGPAEVLLKSSNLSVSRSWNSRIQTDGKGAPRWALVWKLSGKLKKGKEFTWHVYDVELAGQCPPEAYDKAKAFHETMQAA